MTRPLRICALLAGASSCLPFHRPGYEDPYFSEWQRIEAVREVAEARRHARGDFPSDLGEICPDASVREWPCDGGVSARVRDRWGNALWYEPSSDRYRIGSAGPDGMRGTSDDLDIDSAQERERALALAGCYRVDPPGGSAEAQARLLVLDTVRVRLLRSELEAFASAPPQFAAPKWHPWRHDSILVTWAEVEVTVEMRLQPRADTLVGFVDSPTGVEEWWGEALPFPVRAVRVPCGGAPDDR